MAAENTLFTIIGHKLNGLKLPSMVPVTPDLCFWTKGIDDYLTSEAFEPKKEDPKYQPWKTKNNQVISIPKQ